jgi:hypothetical protein
MTWTLAKSLGALVLLAACPIGAHAQQLPDRRMECSIGHVINFDPSHDQSAAELRYDGWHRLVLFLAHNQRLTGTPPDPIEDAPKVDPRTRIVEDPDHISAQPDGRFGRLIDLWPDRVELSTPIAGGLLNAIVLRPIDEKSGTVNLFMLRASELTHFDPAHIYQGTCRIIPGPANPPPQSSRKPR